MLDLTMCRGDGCPYKMNCLRHRAEPSEQFQEYFETSPYDGLTCGDFIQLYCKNCTEIIDRPDGSHDCKKDDSVALYEADFEVDWKRILMEVILEVGEVRLRQMRSISANELKIVEEEYSRFYDKLYGKRR
jgi:hypothetical protein